MRCHLCSRKLNNPNDPLSLDCGGDCQGCIIDIEDTDTPLIKAMRNRIIRLEDRLNATGQSDLDML